MSEVENVEELETVGATYLGYFYSKANRAVWPAKAHELVDREKAESIISAEREKITRAWENANNWLAKFSFAEEEIEKWKSEAVSMRETLIDEQSKRLILESENASLIKKNQEIEDAWLKAEALLSEAGK